MIRPASRADLIVSSRMNPDSRIVPLVRKQSKWRATGGVKVVMAFGGGGQAYSLINYEQRGGLHNLLQVFTFPPHALSGVPQTTAELVRMNAACCRGFSRKR